MELFFVVLILSYLSYIFDRPNRYLAFNRLSYEEAIPFNFFDYIWLILITFLTGNLKKLEVEIIFLLIMNPECFVF